MCAIERWTTTCSNCLNRSVRDELLTQVEVQVMSSENDSNLDEPCSFSDWVKTTLNNNEPVVYNCEHCNHDKATRSRSILKAPDILLCSLKLGVNESDNDVQAPCFRPTKRSRSWTEIEYLKLEVPGANEDTLTIQYQLYGIIFHTGATINQGHYTFCGRGSGCSEFCDGMTLQQNVPVLCHSAQWRYWNDQSVAGPFSLSHACSLAMGPQNVTTRSGSMVLLNSGETAPYMLFFSKVPGSDDRNRSTLKAAAAGCSLCHKGHAWRETIRQSAFV